MAGKTNTNLVSRSILVTEIYPALRAAGVVESKAQFSREWLGRHERFLLVRRGQQASLKVLKVLLPKLQSRGLFDLAAKVQREILS